MIRPALGLLALTLTAAAVAPVFLPSDLSTIPPAAADVHKALTDSGARLASQVNAAESALGGFVTSATLDHVTGTAELVMFTADKQLNVSMAVDGTVASQSEKSRFPGAPVSGAWTETDSGLKYYDMEPGGGESPASSATEVRVHYSGWLLDGTKFDSSVDRGTPADFPLNGVIAGWTEGVGSMKVGGKRKLIIPFKLAYGERGRPPVIPARATLVFDITLLEILH